MTPFSLIRCSFLIILSRLWAFSEFLIRVSFPSLSLDMESLLFKITFTGPFIWEVLSVVHRCATIPSVGKFVNSPFHSPGEQIVPFPILEEGGVSWLMGEESLGID